MQNFIKQNGLYIKISLSFLLILILLSFVYMFVAIKTARTYSEEVNQRVNSMIAEHIVEELEPLIQDGKANEKAMQELFHHLMVINPAIEVYLLDQDGLILNYIAPNKKIEMKRLMMPPIYKFLESKGQEFILGCDPRDPDKKKVFSTAEINEKGKLLGYVYVILAGEEYASITEALFGSYFLKLGIRSMLLSFLAAALIAFFIIWYFTSNIRHIIDTVKRFKNGHLKARINTQQQGELTELSLTFNEMADTLEKNIQELKSIEKLRRELIANVSHDLRTPISTIYGFTETLIMKKDTIPEEEKNRFLEIILQNTAKLKKQVDELFELSKLESNTPNLQIEPISIAELVSDVVYKYKIIAQEKGISINTFISKNLPLVKGDMALVDRALQNLIDNAIKFCKNGDSINIELIESKKEVQVIIADTGIGIPEEDIPYIFDRYHIGKNNKHRQNSTGLGLAIVKKIIELHESSISVKSKVKEGTTISFALPFSR